MPALSPTSLVNITLLQNATTNVSDPTSNALQVVCAWPVSGQYGLGSRVLYYVLVAACVFARRAEWLRNACLAAALLFPAVAAIHGIVLTAVHVSDAVDMDLYGAFQLCSIGILAAPVTVRLSRTYFYDPGRNAIFLWTGLLLTGLLSLTVEFYRTTEASTCFSHSGKVITPTEFRYPDPNDRSMCNLTCSAKSPIRGGPAGDTYVIPVPDKLTFGTATLLAAACCIPAILSLISMWNKILEINWKTRFGSGDEDERMNEPIEGTNGATIGKMRGINNMIRLFLSVVEVPVFGGAVLAILVIGERNFFSAQVWHQTEPMESIGQWGPIVGAGLGALGSLYLLLAADVEAVKEETNPYASMRHCNCSHHHHSGGRHSASHVRLRVDYSPSSGDAQSIASNVSESPPQGPVGLPAMQEVSIGHQIKRSWTTDLGNRRKVAKTLTVIGNYLGTAAHDLLDDSEFKHGKANDYPEIPGEEHRNRALRRIREQYNQHRDTDGDVTPVLREQRSGAGSFNGSVASGLGIEGSSTTPRATSPYPLSPSPSPTIPRRLHAGILPAERISFELQSPAFSSSTGSTRGRLQLPRDTLEVPSPVHHNPMRNNLSASSTITRPRGQSSPAIVVSPDPDVSSPAQASIQPTRSPSSSEPLPPPQTTASPPSS